ncbi:hypothetical protein OTSGILL_2721 [Orientia tsutsugamushi str. Gilliam]|uniref:Repeat-containing protein D n=1 Tax=Orientia tsutsugamushi str. Gilliam TaxID=1359184 RepID=A0A0F3M5T0_ORITS|nr:hypothetical protein [Orientia tsutsugamushi]KJV50837.1 hypothetical protein OTSGILL_2721 [Orientia tsutsugamushi str. Gilliam]SPR04301.1 repeat-containing protein D [Orientia tsutsugamushi str. Gilliam]
MEKLFKILEIKRESQKNVKDFVSYFKTLDVNNQSQTIESYQENNIENLQIIRQMHTEEVMPSVEKRKLCYDKHEDLYTHKRQCNNHEVNNGNITELALNEQENSINVDCPTSVSISHLAGESTYILSDTAGYSAYILE